MELKFSITNQTLKRVDENKPVEKSQDYLYCYFDFLTNDWEKATNKYAIFTNEEYNDEKGNALAYEIIDNKCLVPNEILNSNELSFKVNVVGTNESGLYILPTSVEYVRLNKTGSLDGMQPSENAPTIYQKLVSEVNASFSDLTYEFNRDSGKLKLNFISNDKSVKSFEVDLPTEELVKNVEFDSETKDINIEWGNGQTTKIPLNDLIVKDYNDLINKPNIPQKLSDLILDVDLGVNEEDVLEIIEENSEPTETLGIGTSATFDGTSDEQIPTSKAVSDFVASAGGSKLYRHIIYSSSYNETLEVITSVNEPFTKTTFIEWLINKGHTSNKTALPFQRVDFGNNATYITRGIYVDNSKIWAYTSNYKITISENTFTCSYTSDQSNGWLFTSDTVTEL